MPWGESLLRSWAERRHETVEGFRAVPAVALLRWGGLQSFLGGSYGSPKKLGEGEGDPLSPRKTERTTFFSFPMPAEKKG